MRESDDQRLEECLAAFAARDYISCYEAATRDPLPTDFREQPVLFHLTAICLQRLGQLDDPDELRRLMLDLSESPWQRSLVQLTFGQTPLDTVLRTADDEEQRCQATYYAGARLLTVGRTAEAEELLRDCAQRSVHCVERRLAEIELTAMSGSDAPETTEQMFQAFLARAQNAVRQGRYQDGVRAAEEACDLARRSWGLDGVPMAQGLAVLLIALTYGGLAGDAVQLAPRALSLGREHFGDEDPQFADLLNTVAYAHKSLGELEEASRLYQAAVDIWARSAEHLLEHAAALNNIAQIKVEQGDLEHAEELFQSVLEMLDGLDDDIGLYAGVVNNLALVLNRKRDFAGAERLHRLALDHCREKFGEEHPQYAASLNNLAHVYKDQGRFADAEPLFHRAADILERAHGIRHPHTMMAFNALLEIYQATGQREAADRVVAHVRSGLPLGPTGRGHVLHPLPALTPVFHLLSTRLGELSDEPEVAGGPLDWKSPSYQRMFAELADHFVEGRYRACLWLALRLNAHETTHEVLQIWLMCGGQFPEGETGAAQEPDSGGPFHSMQWLIADPWYSALVGLTLGRVSSADLTERADSDESLCQLRYYTAHRQMIDGHIDEALGDLTSAATSGAGCFEAWMAARLVRGPRRASDRDLAARVSRLNAVAGDGLSRKDFEMAIPAAEEAWRLAAGLEEGSPERTLSHYNLAMAAYSTGDRDQAESLLQELLAMTRGAEHYDRVLVAGALNVLGQIHIDLARFERAEPALLDALEELRLAGEKDGAFYAQVQHNLASLYEEMDDLDSAVRVGREALENKRARLGGDHPEYARTLNNLGVVYAKLGELRTAEELLTGAQRIRQAVLPPDHVDLGVSARALAYLYAEQRRYDEAATQARTALEIDRSAYGPDSLGQATALALLAHCLMTSRPDEARRYLEESRTILERVVGTVHPYSVTVTANLAVLHALEGDLRGALRLTDEAERTASRLLFDVFATASERQRLQLLDTVHARLSLLLSLVAALDAPDEDVAGAYEIVLRRKGVVGEAQGAFRDETYERGTPELRAKIDHIRLLREKVARKTLSGPGAEGPEAHFETLADWTDEKERLEAELARATPATGLERRMRDLDAELVRSLLPADSALVEVVRFDLLNLTPASADEDSAGAGNRYWAFVLRPAPHEGLRLVDLGDADVIDRLIATYREAVAGADSDRDVAPRPTKSARKAELEAGGELRARSSTSCGRRSAKPGACSCARTETSPACRGRFCRSRTSGG